MALKMNHDTSGNQESSCDFREYLFLSHSCVQINSYDNISAHFIEASFNQKLFITLQISLSVL